MKKRFSLLSIFVLTALCLLLLPSQVQAATATEGPLTYVVAKEKVIVVACDPSVSGKLTIPTTLGGVPVG